MEKEIRTLLGKKVGAGPPCLMCGATRAEGKNTCFACSEMLCGRGPVYGNQFVRKGWQTLNDFEEESNYWGE